MTLFPDHPPRPRLTVFADFVWPRAADAERAGQLSALGRALGVDVAVVHSVVPDPTPLPPALRTEVGQGLFVPQLPPMHDNDRCHFQRTLPARVESLLAVLAAHAPTGCEELLERPELREAFAAARIARAWSAELVVSFDLEAGSLPAFVTAALLGLPRIVVLTAPPPQNSYGQLLSLHLQQADAVVVASDALAGVVRAAGGARLGDRLLVVPGGDLAAPGPRAVVAALLTRPVEVARGPRAALVTAPQHAPASLPRPFVVLGAERTGSNLLVELLAANTGVVCAGELFNPRSIAEDELGWLPGAEASSAMRQLRRADPGGLLDRLQADAAAAGAGLAGWKLLYGHAVIDDRITDAMVARAGLVAIHLRRADRLARCLSMVRAQRSDTWYASASGSAPPPAGPVRLDPQMVATDFVLHELLEARFTALFRHHSVLELDYAELAGQRSAVVERLGAFLGVPLTAVPPHSRKTGGDDPAHAIENLAALRAGFAGTRWSDRFGG